jgi:hypothetical protein
MHPKHITFSTLKYFFGVDKVKFYHKFKPKRKGKYLIRRASTYNGGGRVEIKTQTCSSPKLAARAGANFCPKRKRPDVAVEILLNAAPDVSELDGSNDRVQERYTFGNRQEK